MFIVFKKRNFSDLINDTITFFKTEGKTFFKNYFALCGVLLLFIVLCIYFIFDIAFQDNSNGSAIDTLIENNMAIFILLVLIAFVGITVTSIISTVFPIYYLKGIVEAPNEYNSTKYYRKMLMKDFGRLFKFFLISLVTIFPLMLIIFSISALLIFIIIGIPIIMILFPAITSWFNLALYEYISNRNSFFKSFEIALNMLQSKFWIIIGNTFLIFLMIQIVSTVLSIIPQVFFYGGILFSDQSTSSLESTFGFKIMLTAVMVLTTITSFVMNNLMIINQGLVYYSCREQKENTQSHADIDMIGYN